MLGGLRHLGSDLMQHFRPTTPNWIFWVDVRRREFDGKWLAVADLADQPDLGMGTEPREAPLEALTQAIEVRIERARCWSFSANAGR